MSARNDAIMELAARGDDPLEIACALGLSHGVVRGVIGRARAAERRAARRAVKAAFGAEFEIVRTRVSAPVGRSVEHAGASA
jgi:hypothetical protein